MAKGLAAALFLGVLAGCATTGSGVSQSTIGSFKPGVTTVAEAEAALGQPYLSFKQPDGGEQLQYVTKVDSLAGDGMAETGSSIPKRQQSTVSTMLSFDQNGHFVRAWSNSKTKNNNWPSNLGNLGQGDMNMGAGH